MFAINSPGFWARREGGTFDNQFRQAFDDGFKCLIRRQGQRSLIDLCFEIASLAVSGDKWIGGVDIILHSKCVVLIIMGTIPS